MTISPAHLLGLALGPALWTFLEYVLHRWAFHEAGGSNYGSREHLRHHSSEDSVLESWYLSWSGIGFVGLIALPFAGSLAARGLAAPAVGQLAWGVGLGLVAGYGFYDWIHWRAHRRPIANAYEARVRKHHFTHHFQTPLANHGVTSPLWDHVFGTYVAVDRVVVPRRLAMRWLLDEDGAVRAEYAHDYVLRDGADLDERQRELDRARAFANQAPVL